MISCLTCNISWEREKKRKKERKRERERCVLRGLRSFQCKGAWGMRASPRGCQGVSSFPPLTPPLRNTNSHPALKVAALLRPPHRELFSRISYKRKHENKLKKKCIIWKWRCVPLDLFPYSWWSVWRRYWWWCVHIHGLKYLREEL